MDADTSVESLPVATDTLGRRIVRRRHRTMEEKVRIVEESLRPGASGAEVARDPPKVPKLVSVETREPRTARRPPRALPAELPRVVQAHEPGRCTCPECGGVLRKLGEDVSE